MNRLGRIRSIVVSAVFLFLSVVVHASAASAQCLQDMRVQLDWWTLEGTAAPDYQWILYTDEPNIQVRPRPLTAYPEDGGHVSTHAQPFEANGQSVLGYNTPTDWQTTDAMGQAYFTLHLPRNLGGTAYAAFDYRRANGETGSSLTCNRFQISVVTDEGQDVMLSFEGDTSSYVLVGDVAPHLHPGNHWVYSWYKAGFEMLAGVYHSQYAGLKLAFNDMSLVKGGKFDINGSWAGDHRSHHAGTVVDIRANVNYATYAIPRSPSIRLWFVSFAELIFGATPNLEFRNTSTEHYHTCAVQWYFCPAAQPPLPAQDTLFPGGTLTAGQSITSQSGKFKLEFLANGNLVWRRVSNNRALWTSGTANLVPPVTTVVLDGNGSLKLLNASGGVVRQFGTGGGGSSANSSGAGAFLVAEDDGRLLLYADDGTELMVLATPLDGDWWFDYLCQIWTDGTNMLVRNEWGDTQVAISVDEDHIQVPGWDNLIGTVVQDGDRINWANGTNWTRPIEPTVSLQADNGQFVCAEGNGPPIGEDIGAVNANRDVAGPWETFFMVDQNGGSLMDGDPVSFRSGRGYYFTAVNGGGDGFVSHGTGPWTDETFTIIDLDNPGGQIASGDRIGLASINGPFVCAEGGGGSVVNANRPGIGAWETFRIIIH